MRVHAVKAACFILGAIAIALVGASSGIDDGCIRARQLAADSLKLVGSRTGDYRQFVAAVRHSSGNDDREAMLPTVVILGGEQDPEVAQELASNLGLWGGYALVVNGTQVELELGLTVGERLTAHLEYLRGPVVRAIREDKIRSLPGPAVFANIANNGINKVAFVATPDPFPSAKNYVVLGIGSSARLAMELAQQGWPASVAMDPNSTVVVPSELGNGTLMVLTGKVAKGDRMGQETRELVEAGHVLTMLPFTPSDTRMPGAAFLSLAWQRSWEAMRTFLLSLQETSQVTFQSEVLEYCSFSDTDQSIAWASNLEPELTADSSAANLPRTFTVATGLAVSQLILYFCA